MNTEAQYRIGVDVGGTFTDCVLRRPDATLQMQKSPTTPDDQSDGVLAGVTLLASGEGMTLSDLLSRTRTIVHGTTTGDNTMIQMTGAPTGLIVTRGFRDEIEFRRCYKEDIWDPALPAPRPIARRRVRLEVDERLTAEGDIDTPLDEEQVRAATKRLRAFGVTSIAICFLHSYLNPVHELRAREIVLEEYPDVEMISLSHEVLSKPPEFERTSTTLVNAYVGPPIARYLNRLAARLADAGYAYELLVATSAGGLATAATAAKRAVATIGSGPTGGVSAAAEAAARTGIGDVVSVDMGGTSYDVCLIRDGRPEIKMDWNWFQRYCIGIPMVDIPSVGAGGGSIIWEEGGILHVGPHSAQSQPGPVCYSRGGTEPTVTDADLLLGRIDPVGFSNGRMKLDLPGAEAALAELGRRVGMDAYEVAGAAVRLVDALMTDAIRRVLSLAGADPRNLTGPRARYASGAHSPCGGRPFGLGPTDHQPCHRQLQGVHLAVAGGGSRSPQVAGRRTGDAGARRATGGRRARRGNPAGMVAAAGLPGPDLRRRHTRRRSHRHSGCGGNVPSPQRRSATHRGARAGTDRPRRSVGRDRGGHQDGFAPCRRRIDAQADRASPDLGR